MTGPAGEMSFLDHLEELRWRLLWSLGALVLGFALGLWLVDHFHVLQRLKEPIEPYLTQTDGKLVAVGIGEGMLVWLKLSFVVGLVLASPVILWQLWAFLTPALYQREKRVLVPALFAGLALFLMGATLGYFFLLPRALAVLLNFQNESIAQYPTFNSYFGFVLQVVLALGISFELPLIIIILSWFGVIGPAELNRFRRVAIVLAFVAGAVLSPGADILSMIMMTVPLIILYEVGFAGSLVVQRRRRRQTATTVGLLAALCVVGTPASAQEPVQTRADSLRADSLRRTLLARQDTTRIDSLMPRPGQSLDSATARRMGLPTAPARNFATPDSVMKALLDRRGYASTRYRADSAVLHVDQERMLLVGQALTERQGSLLEADTISYEQASCVLDASGDPHLFDHGQVLVGQGISYNSCTRRGVVTDALTNFTEGATVWFLRGDVSQDSSSSRIYAASSELTSCDLPVPHYHFAARQVKWLSHNVLVARPVVLYVADVPILWLPFIFQDMRPGRRSGILVPQFGINDLIRPNHSYNRQITNIGYYWAPNDYIDLAARLDWYSNSYVQYGVAGQYQWLNRFLSGSMGWNQQRQQGGSSSMTIRWDHRQQFNLSTNLNFNLNYTSDPAVVQQNAIDPLVNTQQITSALNFSKRLSWGTVTLGGSRRQNLTDRTVQQQLPTFTISPVPIEIGSNVTWSPGLSLTNNTATNVPLPSLVRVLPGGGLDTVPQTSSSRITAFNLNTPLRVGSFNWQNSVQMTDDMFDGRNTVQFRTDDPSTPDPTDSLTVTQVYTSRFQTSLDWDTGINLPILFRGSWKLQPVLGIANATSSAPFALRNRNTNGDFIVQGKRFRFGLSAAPTLFAFFPGIGPISRIRHSFSPVISYNYAPAARISEEFARAIATPGQPIQLRSAPTQALSVSLSQVFEGKQRPAAGDTAGTNVRKLRLLSISTSGLGYDFEQAKEPGRTGWVTQTISNSLLSDLVPGFNLSLTHDLWRGMVGSDTAQFDPFLQSVSASFAISSNTLCALGSIIRLCHRAAAAGHPREVVPTSYVVDAGGRRPGSFSSTSQLPLSRGRAFVANFNYNLSRSRLPTIGESQSLGFSTTFLPTPFWSLSWSSQYNITDAKFESQVVRLERDLHEWRASFNFVRNANGNVSFYFSISLTDLPDLKFDYDQTTFEQ